MIKLKKCFIDAINNTRAKKKASAPASSSTIPVHIRSKSNETRIAEENTLERAPKADNFTSTPKKETSARKSKRASIGDFLIKKNMVLAEEYKNDLEEIALANPDISFFRSLNETSVKEMKSILEKIAKRSEQFKERGFSGVIRDGVRARIFISEPEKNYKKIIELMQKKRYQVAQTFLEDAEGKIIMGENGKPIMIEDIDVRFGEKGCKSGYSDVQIRFIKKGVLYELIVLPGPNYLETANREHKLLYEQLRKYKILGLDKDAGAKQIINAIEEEFYKLSRSWYADALLKDKKGVAASKEQIAFTPESIKTLNDLFKSLKNLFLGVFNSKPPSKRFSETFKDTKTYQNLSDIELELKKVMEMFKPINEA